MTTSHEATREELPEVFAIYEEAFPSSERVPVAVLERDIGNGRACVVLRADEHVVAFAILLHLSADEQLLEFMAVSSAARGQGLGTRLLDIVRAGDAETVIFEVEDPAEPGIDDAEALARRRRVSFYAAQGGTAAPSDIGFRPPSFDGTPVPRMRVLTLKSPRPSSLAEEFRRLATVAEKAYGRSPAAEVSRPAG